MAPRKAVTKEMARRYERDSRTQKTLMLDEFCALTGWTRRHARRALSEAIHPPPATGALEEGPLLLVEVLVAQQDHEVLVPRIPDVRERRVVDRPRRVHAADLGAKCG